MNKIKAKLAVVGSTVLPLLTFAEGTPTAPDPTTMATNLEGTFSNWINAGATALVSLLTAGAVIVGVMFIFRVMKKGFGASK